MAQQGHDEQKSVRAEDGTRVEAERLAREALEEIRAGEKEDGEFVLDEARKLDPGAVDAVIKAEKGPITHK
jgi:hypothetical protein